MRVLLDENMPQGFRFHLRDHDVVTVQFLGLEGMTNGALLAKMLDEKIQVLATLDKNLQHQQNIAVAGIAVIVLHPKSTKLHDVIPLAAQVKTALNHIKAGNITIVSSQ